MTSAVLIVDDRAENLLTLEAVLAPLGAPILQAASGEEALRALLRSDVAVILLDVQMPGMDGFQTADLVRQRRATRHIPIIFITAFGDEFRERGYEAGAVDYISKPFDPQPLRAKVAVFLELHAKNLLLRDQAEQLERSLGELRSTQRALAGQAAELERSNAALERFVHVVSRDLHEPLSTLSGFLQLLEQHLPDDDDDARLFLQRALSAGSRMRSLIDSPLESATTSHDVLVPVPTRLGDLADAVVDDLAQSILAADADVRLAALPVVACDPAKLSQVLTNLIQNALSYRGDQPPRILISAEQTGDAWTIRVRDNGRGIDPDDRERIFTPFLRAADGGGAGVGLAVCRRLIEAHGGRIWVEDSHAPAGSTFAFTLPITPVRAGDAAMRQRSDPSPLPAPSAP